MIKKLLPVGVMTFLAVFLIFAIHTYLYLTSPSGKEGATVVINILPGTGFKQLATELKEKGIVEDIKKFNYWPELKGMSPKLEPESMHWTPPCLPLKF